jgi:hypothetical protein
VLGLFVALAFIAYCVARPTKGWGIFWAGTVPQYGSILLYDAVGVSEWWLYAAFIPLAALWAAAEERELHDEQAADDELGGTARPASRRAANRRSLSGTASPLCSCLRLT